jgi:hypothetical protein
MHIKKVAGQFAAHGIQIRIGRELQLRETRDPGRHEQSMAIAGQEELQLRNEFGPFRPGPNEAHVAAHHIPELRQLINMKRSKDAADKNDPWICVRSPARAGFALTIMKHRADLIKLIKDSISAHPHLRVEGRTTRR